MTRKQVIKWYQKQLFKYGDQINFPPKVMAKFYHLISQYWN